jgi:hypothetical protein
MREVVFQLRMDAPGALCAVAESPAMRITAANLEELHHEARDALIAHFGPAHATVQVRIQRRRPAPRSAIQPRGHTSLAGPEPHAGPA